MRNGEEYTSMPENMNSGGGSGGDMGRQDAGNQIKSAEATYQIAGNQVVLISPSNTAFGPFGNRY